MSILWTDIKNELPPYDVTVLVRLKRDPIGLEFPDRVALMKRESRADEEDHARPYEYGFFINHDNNVDQLYCTLRGSRISGWTRINGD